MSPTLVIRPFQTPARGVAQLVHRFENPEETTIGCHLTGHWESGMRATIVFVSP